MHFSDYQFNRLEVLKEEWASIQIAREATGSMQSSCARPMRAGASC
jgi:hypothetical protein